jgi:hypothetical protein
MANVALALVWVVTGAVTVGAATALAGRRIRLSATILPWCLSTSILLVCCVWLALPVTALALTVDTAQAGAIDCGSSWGSLGASSYVNTDEGGQYALGTGECRAAAWHRVAALGAAEVGLGAVIGASSVLRRRRPEHAPRVIDQFSSL